MYLLESSTLESAVRFPSETILESSLANDSKTAITKSRMAVQPLKADATCFATAIRLNFAEVLIG